MLENNFFFHGILDFRKKNHITSMYSFFVSLFKTLQSNVLLTKPTLLNVDTQALTRNVRYFSNTKTNFNQVYYFWIVVLNTNILIIPNEWFCTFRKRVQVVNHRRRVVLVKSNYQLSMKHWEKICHRYLSNH